MPKIVDHSAYRDELLAQAFPVLARRGMACPIRELAREIGVSTGTLYHYFPNKRALFESLAEFMARGQIEAAKALSASIYNKADLFNRLMDMAYSGRAEITALILLSVDTLRQQNPGEMRNFFQTYFKRYAKALSELLDITTDQAHLIIACADGLLLHGWIHWRERTLKRRLQLFADMVRPWLDGQTGDGHA